MSISNGWDKLVQEGRQDGARALARLIYFCEIGEIDQHLSPYLTEIADENTRLHKQLQAESLAFYLLRDERDNLTAELAVRTDERDHYAAELAAARKLLKQMADCNPWNDSPNIPVVDYAAYTNAAKKFIE